MWRCQRRGNSVNHKRRLVKVVAAALWLCNACAPDPDPDPNDSVPQFGDTVGRDSGDAPGESAGPEASFDGVAGDPRCEELVIASCEPSCEEDPSCEAAQLLREFAPSRCAAALDDEQRYPSCRPGTCAELVARVCGAPTAEGGYACADDPGCGAALQLLARAEAAPAPAEEDEANLACLQASADEALFRDCNGS